METTMRANLLQLSEQIDDDYYTLLQLSQQMTTQGAWPISGVFPTLCYYSMKTETQPTAPNQMLRWRTYLCPPFNLTQAVAVANHQPEIDRFIYQLNYILSYSLGKTDQRATFRTELKSLELYLELQKERYDFNIRYEVEPGDYLDYPCARLILQPLVENAVCHNMNEFGNLWVTMRLEDGGRVRVVIRDDGCGFDPAAEGTSLSQSSGRPGKGIGLRYVQLTLFSFYGESANIQIESQKGTGTTVALSLPVRPEQQESS